MEAVPQRGELEPLKSPQRNFNATHVSGVMKIHREIWNNDILRPELPLSPFNGDLCRVYTTSWVLKRELAAHSKSQALYQEVFS